MGREEGSGWGPHVYLWRIHFDIWQNQYNIVKFKNKIKFKKKRPDDTPENHPKYGYESALFVTAVYRWAGRTFFLILAHHFLALKS